MQIHVCNVTWQWLVDYTAVSLHGLQFSRVWLLLLYTICALLWRCALGCLFCSSVRDSPVCLNMGANCQQRFGRQVSVTAHEQHSAALWDMSHATASCTQVEVLCIYSQRGEEDGLLHSISWETAAEQTVALSRERKIKMNNKNTCCECGLLSCLAGRFL